MRLMVSVCGTKDFSAVLLIRYLAHYTVRRTLALFC